MNPNDHRPGLEDLRADRFVIIIDPERPLDPPRHGRVTKLGKVWLHITQTAPDGTPHDHPRTWRMNIAKQNEGLLHGFGGDRFVTREQFRWERRAADAVTWLREQRIEVAWPSEWWERRLLLANLLRDADGLPPF